MHFTPLALPISLLGLVAAQASTPTITSAASTASSSSVAGLVAQLPQCALSCFSTASSDVGCNSGDIACLCNSSEQLVSKIGPCVLLNGGCSSDDIDKAKNLAPEICDAVKNSPNSADVASASNLVTAAVGSASATANPTGNVAVRTDVAMGAMGVAAAFAVFAL